MIFQAQFLRSTSILLRRNHPAGPRKNLLALFCLLLIAGALTAQTTWDGSSSSDWNTDANWSAGVPGVDDDVTIPNVATKPVIGGGIGAVAKTVTINAGAQLTINSGSGLALNGASSAQNSLTNSGTVTNNGTLDIGSVSNAGQYGIYNTGGTFTNNGRMNLDRTSVQTITNSTGGTFNNNGKIYIGALGPVGQAALFTSSTFNNNACAVIHVYSNSRISGNVGNITNAGIIIDNATSASDINLNTGIVQNLNGGVFVIGTNQGIRLDGAGKIWTGCISTAWNVANNWHDQAVPTATDDVHIYNLPNDPVISFGTSAVARWLKVNTGGLLTINTGGSLSMDNTANSESIDNAGTIENSGMIQIGASVNGGGTGLYSDGLVNNNTGGEVKIDRTGTFACINNGMFNNAGKITLGSIAAIGQAGLTNSGTVNNNAGGEIKGDNCTHTVLWNHNNGVFNNYAKITIGSAASVGEYGLRNWNIFNNYAAGEITIDRATVHGIYNINSFADFAEFYNAGKITVGAVVPPTQYGVYNDNTFVNQSCGELRMFAPLFSNAASGLTNNGHWLVGTASAHSNTALTNNGIIEYPLGNPIPNVTNNDLIIKPFTTACSGSPAMQIGGANSFTIGTTWYSNQGLTVPAGTFNLATNTFTWNSTPASGTYTVYFSVNDAGNGCARTVSAAVTVVSPVAANAGPNQTICSTTGSATMAGNTPNIGTGTWTKVSGPTGGSITSPNSPTTTITSLTTEGTYVFQWTIANPGCPTNSSQVSIIVKAPPTTANAGSNANPCGLTTNLASNAATTGTGTWTLFNGPGTAGFVNANLPTTSVTVSVAGAYTFRWTIANAPCTASTDDVDITFTTSVTPANAGGNQTICTTSGSATMAGNTPSVGTGTWSQVSGPVSAAILNPNSPTTSIIDMTSPGTYVFKWSIANPPCTASEDQMSVVANAPPTASNAGPDASPCGLTTALAGNAPGTGTGTWTLFNGPGTAGFVNANSPTTSVTVSVAGAYTFRWTIANAPCTASFNDVVITFTAGPTTANASGDQTVCTTSGSATMAGNTPSVGTGTWSQVSGPVTASITSPNSPTTTITGMTTAGTYVFKWSIANPPCTASEGQMSIVVKAPPTTANAGTNASPCGLTTNLAGNAATTGTGTWTLFNGPGTANFVNANSPTTSITVSVAGAYTFRWTIANAPCAASFNDVIITFTAGPTTANAGGDQTVCTTSGSATMAGNTPSIGTGTWSQVSGPVTASITSPNSPTTTITGMTTAGTYVFKWSIANPPCTASEDQMSVVANAPPTASNAGSDASPCGLTTNLAGNAPGTGTGTWTLFSGPGTANFVNANSPTTSVTVSLAGAYTFRWTIANAPCAASFNDVVITFTAGPTTANAGGDQTSTATCGLTQVTLAGNAPTIGTGMWSVQSGAGGSFGNASSPTSDFSGNAGATYTLRWTVTNSPCPASTDEMVVTFNQSPSFSNCPGTTTVSTTSGCSATAAYAAAAASTTPAASVAYTFGGATTGSGSGTGSGSTFNLGTTTVSLTATNSCGSTNCIFNVVVQAGEINVQGNAMSILDGDNAPTVADHTDFGQTTGASVVRTFTVQNTGSANLLVTGITTSGSGAAMFTVGPLTPASPIAPNGSATFTVTYSSNAVGTQTATVNIASGDCDEATYDFAIKGELTCSPPTFTACPTNLPPVNASAGQCSAAVTYTAAANGLPSPTLTYACTGASSGSGSGSGSGSAFSTGVTTVTVTATNPCGAPTCSFTVTVLDNQNPSITCPGNMAKNTDSGQCSAVTAYANPTFSDNCSGASIVRTSGPASGAAFPTGTTNVAWKATDTAGNSAVCNFTVTVNDAQAPSIACPANQTKSTDVGLCTAVATYANPSYSDNCTGAGLDHISGGLSGTAFSKGTTSVIWQATDGVGLTKRCTFTVTVNDNQLPTVTCPANQTKTADAGLCTAVTDYTTPTFTDNCTGGSVAIQSGLASGSAFPKGITTVVWRATDGVGLTKTCSFRVTVNDTQAPTISCPSSQSLNTDPSLCSAIATYSTPTATDNCTPPPTVLKTSGLASGSAFPKGSSTVVWKATDGAGLTQTCSFTITVTDVQLPTIACPANISATGSGSPCMATVTYAAPTAADNCTVQSVFPLSGPASGSQFPAGTTTVVWQALDNSGLSATCAFTVAVGCGTNSSEFEVRSLKSQNADPATSIFKLQTSNFKLYPNPATTQVQIWTENLGEKDGDITVLDARGRTVWQYRFGPEALPSDAVTLDVSGGDFAAGLYFVTLRSDGKAVTKRLVVQRL